MTHLRPFPLYDHLLQRAKESAVPIDARRLCNTINKIPDTMGAQEAEEHIRAIAALCLHHELTENSGVAFFSGDYPPPFKGMKLFAGKGGKGVTMNAANIPPILLQILQMYIEENREEVSGK